MESKFIWKNSLSSLSKLLDEQKITPSELVDVYLERSKKVNPEINAFTQLDEEGAREQARLSTLRYRENKKFSLLDGIPITIKDNIYVKGMKAEWGSLLYKNNVADQDDICVERLRNAGCVVMGKTTTPEFALIGRTESRISGYTRNPWDTRLTPGGSSGGAAASVAAGLAPFAIGTDAGGSIRLPSSYTGTVGLRPSTGAIPRRYGFPAMALDFQVIGLLGKTVSDVELVFQEIAGRDKRDILSEQANMNRKVNESLKIGWFAKFDDEDACDPEVANSLGFSLDLLADEKHQIVNMTPPFSISELRDLWDVLTSVGAARVALEHDDWKSKLTEQTRKVVERGLKYSATEYVRALDRLQSFKNATNEMCDGFDAFVLPTTPAPAWKVEEASPELIAGRKGVPERQGIFCSWVNALGYCGINVPSKTHPDGRHIGVQVISKNGCDHLIIKLAKEIEKGTHISGLWPEIAYEQ